MGFLKKIFSIFNTRMPDRNYWFYVECHHCKEILKGRVDLYNHLSVQYGEGKDGNSYYCRKVMIGANRCYRPIEVEFWFDADRKLSNKEIKGGTFVTEQDYLSQNPDPE